MAQQQSFGIDPTNILTFLLGSPDSDSFFHKDSESQPWFSPNLKFCCSSSRPEVESYTFEELKQWVKELGSGFRKAGIRDGDRVMVIAPDSIYMPVLMLGTWAAGALFATGNINGNAEQQAAMIRFVQPRLLLTHPDYIHTAEQAARLAGENEIAVFSFEPLKPTDNTIKASQSLPCKWYTLFDRAEGHQFRWPTLNSTSDMDKTILIEFTSGTTGSPKGAELTHSSLIKGMRMHAFTVPQQMRWYSDYPYYGNGAKVVFLSALRSRFLLVVHDETFVLTEYLSNIDKYKTQLVAATKRTFDGLCIYASKGGKANLSSVQRISSGGGIISQKTRKAVNGLCGGRKVTTVGYACTESGPISSEATGAEPGVTTSQGKLAPGVELRVKNDEGDIVPSDQDGHLWFRPPGIAKGYWRDPAKTKQAFDSEGFFDIGDNGYLDAKTGELHITGRTKELIKVRGRQINPNDIEAELFRIAGVAIAVVVHAVNEDGEELPAAFIVRNQERAELAQPEHVQSHLKTNMSEDHQLTGGVFFLEEHEMPYSGNGKNARLLLKQWAQDRWDERHRTRISNGI